MKDIFECFRQLRWPNSIDIHEDEFNKDKLLALLNAVNCLVNVEHVDEKVVRKQHALPFFGWGSLASDLTKINGNVKSDIIFSIGAVPLIIENKLIRKDKNEECNIKNALVQTIEYLNLYNATGAILLIFDAGRAKDREWGDTEHDLIRCLISKYPLCVVRIREGYDTKIYYEYEAQKIVPADAE